MYNQRIYNASQRGYASAQGRATRRYYNASKPKPPIASLRDFLGHVVAQVREDKRFWTKGESEKAGGLPESTATNAVGRARQGFDLTERDLAGADKVLAHVESINARNEFSQKLVQTVREAQSNGVVPFTAGIIAYAVADYMKAVKRSSEPQATQGSVEVDASRITDLFQRARAAGLKFPKVTFQGEQGLQFALAGPRSKYAGSIMVTDGRPFGQNAWYGRIEGSQFIPSRQVTDEITALIVTFAEDPAKVAAAAGLVTGRCVFCRRSLHEEKGRSQAVGYGPKCAERYGLPWGDVAIQAKVSVSTQDAEAVQPAVAPVADEVVSSFGWDRLSPNGRDAQFSLSLESQQALEGEGASVADAGDSDDWDESDDD